METLYTKKQRKAIYLKTAMLIDKAEQECAYGCEYMDRALEELHPKESGKAGRHYAEEHLPEIFDMRNEERLSFWLSVSLGEIEPSWFSDKNPTAEGFRNEVRVLCFLFAAEMCND